MLILIPIASLLLIGLGVLLWAGVFFNLFTALRLKKQGIPARGVIVGVQTRHVAENVVRAPLVRFLTANQETIEFESYGKCEPDVVGQEVEVLYLPSRPSKAETMKHIQVSTSLRSILGDLMWGAFCILAGAGVVIIQLIFHNYLSY